MTGIGEKASADVPVRADQNGSFDPRQAEPTSPLSRRTFLLGLAATATVGGVGARAVLAGGKSPQFGAATSGAGAESVRRVVQLGRELSVRATVGVTYAAWEWEAEFPTGMVVEARKFGMSQQITWEPWDPRSGAIQPAYELRGLQTFDEYVDRFAFGASAANAGDDLSIRFAHEMNGGWYPWAVNVNGNSADDYVAAFRRTRERFEAAGGPAAVTWNWCPNVMLGDQRELLRASYPGDDVVDVIAVDGYSEDGSVSPSLLFGETIDLLRSIAPDKPLWINETGGAPGPQKAAWIRDAFDYAKSTGIDCVIWFELAQPDGLDWRLLEKAETKKAAKEELARW